VTGQLDSPHFFRAGDTVRRLDGLGGRIEEAWALYAAVLWEDGRREEVDQFDPDLVVVTRRGV
jgi:hypothetical protein